MKLIHKMCLGEIGKLATNDATGTKGFGLYQRPERRSRRKSRRLIKQQEHLLTIDPDFPFKRKTVSFNGKKKPELILRGNIDERQQNRYDGSSSGSKISWEYDSFLVLDFEATCQSKGVPDPQEIIEFPIVEVDASRRIVVSEFQSFVRPIAHPKLSNFCTNLTGITQDQVNNAPTLPYVLDEVYEWMYGRGLFDDKKFLFVTCGGWDFKSALPKNIKYYEDSYRNGLKTERNLKGVPAHFQNWYDLKESFKSHYGIQRTPSFKNMLRHMNMRLIGRHHSGIDDTRNIARMLIRMLEGKENACLPRFCFR